jgi:large subunit ribosomal protein L10
MAVSKSQKTEILNSLIEKFKNAKSIGFASTTGFTVDEFATLRANLREVNATYTIAKKTLIKRAVKEALDIDLDLSTLPGQIGFVCSNEDAVAGLGKVNDMVKEMKDDEKIVWALSIFE